jgi:CBS domain-containing protein
MLVKDIMASPVVTVKPSASIADAARLMLEHNISGLQVVDDDGKLEGIVTEGDFLRRTELGTEASRARWIEYLISTGKVADEYIHSHGRKVAEVMQKQPITCRPDDPLETVVEVMLKRRVKRLPVVEARRLVGIVSRADLLRAMASLMPPPVTRTVPDWEIAADIETGLRDETWAGSLITPKVENGVVTLEGTVFDQRQQQAAHVLVENIPGVKSVIDHLIWVDPTTGTMLGPEELDRS